MNPHFVSLAIGQLGIGQLHRGFHASSTETRTRRDNLDGLRHILALLGNEINQIIGDSFGLVGNGDGPRRYLLRIAREGVQAVGNSTVEWRTNLTYIEPQVLFAHKEDDDTWCCDSIWTLTELDVTSSTGILPCEVEDNTGYRFFFEMAEGSSRPAKKLGKDSNNRPLRFTQNVRFMLADDDAINDVVAYINTLQSQ